MLSHEDRYILRKNQLAEVICQFRFPQILMIDTTPPAQFQEMVRNLFPQYSLRKEAQTPKIINTNGTLQIETPPSITNYQLSSADNCWRINLTSSFISLSCNRYTCWEEFAKRFDKILTAFIKTYSPAYFTRVGLRYMNFISRKDLELAEIPYSELIEACYLGPLAENDVQEHTVTRCTVDTQIQLPGGCTAKIHAGPGMVKRNGISEQEARFIFDQDLFLSGNIPIHTSAGALNTLHRQAYSVFRGAIKDALFQAMEPETI